MYLTFPVKYVEELCGMGIVVVVKKNKVEVVFKYLKVSTGVYSYLLFLTNSVESPM